MPGCSRNHPSLLAFRIRNLQNESGLDSLEEELACDTVLNERPSGPQCWASL